MKPLVLDSVEDESGDRCVDILRLSDTEYGYCECRRDPEDGHGWRRLHGIAGGFQSEAAAREAAHQTVLWMEKSA